MTESIERYQAKHPFNPNLNHNKKDNCVECGHPENHDRHKSAGWCDREVCHHAVEQHEAKCLVKGCSCQQMLHGDFTGRVQELEGLSVEQKEEYEQHEMAAVGSINHLPWHTTEGQDKVDGERQAQHGDPVINLARVAIIWSALIGVQVTAHDVAVMMGAFKKVRQMANPEHQDNLTDIEGYAEIARRCVEAGEYIPMGTQRGLGWK